MTQHVTIPVNKLAFGMFISDLDRPWIETPFLIQGFLLSEPAQQRILQDLCETVVIDTAQSEPGSYDDVMTDGPQFLAKRTYEDTRTFDEEMSTATDLYQQYDSVVHSFYDECRSNKTINVKELDKAVSGVVDSIVRNPDACMFLRQMKRKSDYLHDHAMGMSIWSGALGRQIGLDKENIKTVALAALVCDVGMVGLSDQVLNRPAKLTDAEYDYVKTHVELGLERLRETPGISNDILDIVASHHERFDGSGYPNQLAGEEIPLLARIIGISDCFDAITSNRAHAPARSPSEAVKVLYELRDKEYQCELVEEFIQAVGVFPVGTLVELSTGHIGTVVAEYRRRRLRPRVQVILDPKGERIEGKRFIDLQQVTHTKSGKPVDILRAVDSASVGLDEDDIFL